MKKILFSLLAIFMLVVAVACGKKEEVKAADKKYDEILGVHIVGPSAAEIINEASGLMAMEITVDEVIKTIYAHPTYSEALFEACADALDEAIHLPKKRK